MKRQSTTLWAVSGLVVILLIAGFDSDLFVHGENTPKDLRLEIAHAAGTSSGGLSGSVSDTESGQGIGAAQIDASSNTTSTFTLADASGRYTLTLPADTYTVTASAFGYQAETLVSIEVLSGTTTSQNFSLTPLKKYTLDGYIRDSQTGWPLYASLSFSGFPGNPIWSDPQTGYYSVTLPAGSYQVDLQAWDEGYVPLTANLSLFADSQQDYSLQADPNLCLAQGYQLAKDGLVENFEGSFPPTGWTVVDNEGTGLSWNACQSWGIDNFTSGSGDCALVSSAAFGTAEFDTELWTPILDATTLPTTTLNFRANYQNFGGRDFLEVDVSNDGGITWANALSWNEDHGSDSSVPGEIVSLDLSGFLSGGSNIIRWHYYDPGTDDWDWYAQIDEVRLGSGTCLPDQGGFVIGNVYDQLTGDSLPGAMISNQDGYAATAGDTLDDPSVGEGFFRIFSPAGSKTHTASHTSQYGQDSKIVNISEGETSWQDFTLSATYISADPDPIQLTVGLGFSTTFQLTLSNHGQQDVQFELSDFGGSYMTSTTLAPVSLPAPRHTKDPNLYTGSRTLNAGSRVIQPASSTMLSSEPLDILLLAAADVTQLQALMLAFPDIRAVDIFDARTQTPTLRELMPYDTVILVANAPFFEPDSIGDVLADYLDAGGTMIQSVPTFYDPLDTGWGLRGRFIDGGYSPFTGMGDWFSMAVLDSYDSGHPVMDQVKDAADTFRQVVDLSPGAWWVAGWSDDEFIATKGHVVAVNTFLADGFLWTGDISLILHNSILWLQDLPWITHSSISSTVPGMGSTPAGITVWATPDVVTQTGTYAGSILVQNDTVYGSFTVPVSMTVVAPRSGVMIGPGRAGSANPGDQIIYTVWVTNTANIPDTFDLFSLNETWTTTLSTDSIFLYPGESSPVMVWVSIPMGVPHGSIDSAAIVASSRFDPGVTASTWVSTGAQFAYNIYLPSAVKHP